MVVGNVFYGILNSVIKFKFKKGSQKSWVSIFSLNSQLKYMVGTKISGKIIVKRNGQNKYST